MKDESGIRISEFLDGELSAKELDQLLADMQSSEHQAVLKNYNRIGAALRNEADQYASIDISQAVAAAIKDCEFDAVTTTAASTPAAKESWFASRWFKPALGAAFASVVAMFTITVNQNLVQVDPLNSNQVAQQTSPTNNQSSNDITQRLELVSFERSSALEESKVDLAAREELNNYLVNHARSASGGNYQGMVPYVRAVAYEPQQNEK